MRLIDADHLRKRVSGWTPYNQAEFSARYEFGVMIDHEPTVGGWISVKDRLPCENPWESKWVLVWFGEESELRTEAPLPAKWNPLERTWWIVGFGDKHDRVKLKVTHWMPLPEPPEEVSGDA